MDINLSSLRTWAEVALDAILENHRAMRCQLPSAVKCAAVIKADAYGHGARRIARMLESEVDYFAVAMTDEAEELRLSGITTPILVLAHTQVSDTCRLVRYGIDTTVSDIEEARAIAHEAAAVGGVAGVHIALDTGMSRIGFPCTEESAREIAEICTMDGVRVDGIFSHYAASDSRDLTYTRLQTERFDRMLSNLASLGVRIPISHICNSAAAVGSGPKYDMVREGILLYGLMPSDETDISSFGVLHPAMSLRTHVSSLRTLSAGVPVSYGCTYVTERESRIATLQAGYADGVPRRLSNRGEVLIRGHRAPIAGRVCMDQMMIDVTDVPGVSVGDTATIFGRDGELEISADSVAEICGTIGYEIICGISKRVPRVYTEGGRITGVSRMLPCDGLSD